MSMYIVQPEVLGNYAMHHACIVAQHVSMHVYIILSKLFSFFSAMIRLLTCDMVSWVLTYDRSSLFIHRCKAVYL